MKRIFSLSTRLFGNKKSEIVKEQFLSSMEVGRSPFSDIYYLLVWFDSFLGLLNFRLKGGIVVHDRWLFDFTTFFEHKNYRNKFVIKLFTIFPKPDLFILFTVPPQIALQRKKGDLGHIHHGIEYYQELNSTAIRNAKRWTCDAIIETNRPVDEIVNEVMAIINTEKKRIICLK